MGLIPGDKIFFNERGSRLTSYQESISQSSHMVYIGNDGNIFIVGFVRHNGSILTKGTYHIDYIDMNYTLFNSYINRLINLWNSE